MYLHMYAYINGTWIDTARTRAASRRRSTGGAGGGHPRVAKSARISRGERPARNTRSDSSSWRHSESKRAMKLSAASAGCT